MFKMMIKMNDEIEPRFVEENFINLNPIQRGGIASLAARKAVISYVDGYSICDYCLGCVNKIKKPPVEEFLTQVSEFLGMDYTILTNGCREAVYAVFHSLLKPDDTIVVDANRHYTTIVAAENIGLRIFEIENSGYPEFKINPDNYQRVFDEIKNKTGEYPKLALLTHIDGSYGNLVDAKRVSKICNDYEIPFLLNAAYSSGRMAVNGKKLGADFIATSCHKSWAIGGGNAGFLSITEKWRDKIFRVSKEYEAKQLEILGCSTRGSVVPALLASFPYVTERIKHWDEEVEKTRFFIKGAEKLGLKQLGEKPHNHDLVLLETKLFHDISKKHKKGGYFLYHELRKRNITGIKPGLTKQFKASIYGLNKEQISYVLDAFKDIIEGR